METDRLRSLREAHETLTPREKEVLALLIGGALNKQIAAALGVAEATIKVHRHNIMKKMCVRSTVSLRRILEELGIQKCEYLQWITDARCRWRDSHGVK